MAMQGYSSAPSRDTQMNADMSSQDMPQQDSAMADFKVCIAPLGDGTFSVYTEQGDGQQGDAQSASSVDEALAMAGQMLGGGDGNAPLSAGQAQSYWDQLAAKR
jgi:hypothetical protein